MDIRHESVPKPQVEATMVRLKADLKAAGYSLIILSRENPRSGLWDVLVVPFRQDWGKEKMDALSARIDQLMKEGYQMSAYTDSHAIGEIKVAAINPLGVAFKFGD